MRSVTGPQTALGIAARPIPGRGRMVRRVLLFQLKLMADAARDVVMSPLSIAAGLLGLVSPRAHCEFYFDRLMRFGRDTDQWINLFDHRRTDGAGAADSLDSIADEIERAVRRDYGRGGISARSAKALAEAARRLRQRARGD